MKLIKIGEIITISAVVLITSCYKMNDESQVSAREVLEKSFSNPLYHPKDLNAKSASFAAKMDIAIIGGQSINSLSYGGVGLLGPTLKINQGEIMNLLFTNQLTEPTNIHWHGLEAPSEQDGYPTDVTQAGNSYTYNFRITNRPGTYWYHPHPDMATASQVYRGLAGFFIVTSPEEKALKLPQDDYDVPLVIQDKRLTSGLAYNPDEDDQNIGFFGESVLVNGTSGAFMEVEKRTYRIRLLNGSSARIYNLALSNGLNFKLIGSDGGLLDAPLDVSNILLAPGERADVLINFGSMPLNTELFLESLSFNGSSSQGKQNFKIMKIKIIKDAADNFILPTTLMPVEKISESFVVASRKFNIGHMMVHGGMNGVMHPIDGKTFDANRRDEVVKSGSVEIWEFDNTQGTEVHPMHLHGLQFQVLGRSGGRESIQSWEKGWKDTVLAFPGEKIKIIIRFPNNKGKFVFHCHNLEHEDAGMMLNFEIQ